ncbi:MAG TPA: hypothetical protein VNJ08_16155 [Bacteriovoracaceae bacterium]|nr:hypothetical protein [Bacteriovoracaceae bacterium]
MNLPVYQTITIKSAALEDLGSFLHFDLNLKHPVVFSMKHLDEDEQRELIGLIENYFVTNGISYKFPYPVYILTSHESTISGLPLVKNLEQLPKFFTPKEGKINVKESQLLSKNKLLQQEIRNGDSLSNEIEMKVFGKIHKQLFVLEEERLFYRSLLNKLVKVKSNG